MQRDGVPLLPLLLLLVFEFNGDSLTVLARMAIRPKRHQELTDTIAVHGDIIGGFRTLNREEYLRYRGYDAEVKLHSSPMTYEEYEGYSALNAELLGKKVETASAATTTMPSTISYREFASAKSALGLGWNEDLTYEKYDATRVTHAGGIFGIAQQQKQSGQDKVSPADKDYEKAIQRYSKVVTLLDVVAKFKKAALDFFMDEETHSSLSEAASTGGGSKKAPKQLELIDMLFEKIEKGYPTNVMDELTTEADRYLRLFDNGDSMSVPAELSSRVDKLLEKCKHFVHEVFLPNGPNSKVCVHCLLIGDQDGEFAHFHKIYRLARLQYPRLDTAVQDHIIDGLFEGFHDAEKTKPIALKRRMGEDEGMRIGVVGLSSAGLATVKELLLAGFPVVAFESRPADHPRKRKRVVELGSGWLEELKWLLGSAYYSIFDEATAHQFRPWDWSNTDNMAAVRNEVGLSLELCQLEAVLRQWFETQFLKRIKTRFGEDSGWHHRILQMHYGKEVVGTRLPTAGDPHYRFIVREERKVHGGKPTIHHQPLIGVITAVGKDSDMRNAYLGVPKRRTKSKNYFVVVVEKGDNLVARANLDVSSRELVSLAADDTYATEGMSAHFEKMVAGMTLVLSSEKYRALCPAAQKTMERFQHLGQLLVSGVAEEEEAGKLEGNRVLLPNSTPHSAGGGKIRVTHIMDISGWPKFQVDGIPPSILMDFNASFEAESGGGVGGMEDGCVRVRECIHRLYFDFVLKYSVALKKRWRPDDPEIAQVNPVDSPPAHTFLNIDEYGELKLPAPGEERNPDGLHFNADMFNASMFSVALAALPHPAHYLLVHGVLAFFQAVGDAQALAHFHTGLGVKKIAAEVHAAVEPLSRRYEHIAAAAAVGATKLASVPEWAKQAVGEQNHALVAIGDNVLAESKGFIEHYDDGKKESREEMRAAATRDVCDFINRLARSHPYVVDKEKEWEEWEVFSIECDPHNGNDGNRGKGECISPSHLHFKLHLHPQLHSAGSGKNSGNNQPVAAVPVTVDGEYLRVGEGAEQKHFFALLHAGLYGLSPAEYTASGGVFASDPNSSHSGGSMPTMVVPPVH